MLNSAIDRQVNAVAGCAAGQRSEFVREELDRISAGFDAIVAAATREVLVAIKSLITQVGVDTAGKSHNCLANSKHRIAMGDVRLKVRNGRSWDHYCQSCALNIIARDIAKLQALQSLKK